MEIGLVVGVCSNVYPRYVDQNLPLLGLHRDLDFAATSYEAGALKPSRDVFDAAARKASHVNRLLHGRTQPDVAPGQVYTVHTLRPLTHAHRALFFERCKAPAFLDVELRGLPGPCPTTSRVWRR